MLATTNVIVVCCFHTSKPVLYNALFLSINADTTKTLSLLESFLLFDNNEICHCNEVSKRHAARYGYLFGNVPILRDKTIQPTIFPWSENTCILAAQHGHFLKVLVYLREHGCLWNGSTCTAAARKGELKCLTYAHVHGCP